MLARIVAQPLLGFALCASSCALLLWVMLRSRLAWRVAIDAPNARSLHTRPTPRVGGVALTPVCVVWAWAEHLLPAPVLGATAVLAAISFIDDRHHVPAGLRLAIQLGCAASVILLPGLPVIGPVPAIAELAIVILALVWMANLYNFMDGSDGLAGAMALIGFGAYAVAAARAGDAALAAAAAGCSGAAAGFLCFNWPPARLFLGDMGSVPLGFLAGAIGLLGWQHGTWGWWFPVLVFVPFIADASLTLLARLMRRERVWQAHREHTYQRMVAHGHGGHGHRGTLLRWVGLMVAAAGSALWLLGQQDAVVALVLGGWTVVLIVGFVAGKRAWPRAGVDNPRG